MPDKRAKSDDEALIKEMRKRFKRCETWEAKARSHYKADLKFANGDSRNNYQWPDEQRKSREGDQKPCFTINKVRQNNLQIINDARQNKMAIKVNPVGGGSSYDSAEIYTGCIRHIEYQSNAQNVYTSAVRTQVQAGLGYWRVVTDYADEDSFDQEIFIRRVKDPMSVYLDPDCQEADRSDAKFGFIFETVEKDEAEAKWPEIKGRINRSAVQPADTELGWFDVSPGAEKVRVAEYFRREEVRDELVAVTIPPAVDRTVMKMSALAKEPQLASLGKSELRKTLEAWGAQLRPVSDYAVKWYKIAGDLVVESRDWLGKYIPIVLLIGEETVIDGEMDRKGHTRAQIDAQMNYNFWSSEAATQVALQNKSPYVADLRAIEGHENYWDNANRQNFPYLPYNGADESGVIPKPERQAPPTMAQAYIQGMTIAAEELRMSSGQYQASIGQPSNETSGVAIQQRQRQADNATYHYVDHLANAIRYTGRILIDLIPKIYDTKRIIKIRAEDGETKDVMLDPQHTQAYLEQKAQEGEGVKAIFNPNVGKYAVEADVGPSFATQRQEAFNAISQIMQQSPQIASLVGDLLFQAADFPKANEIAERLRRMVPPQALDDGPDPQIQQLQQQNQELQTMIGQLNQKLAEAKTAQDSKDDRTIIDAYRAETDRIDVLLDAIFEDPRLRALLANRTTSEAMGLNPNTAVALLTTPPPQPAPQMQPQQPQPASAGFSMPGTPQQ